MRASAKTSRLRPPGAWDTGPHFEADQINFCSFLDVDEHGLNPTLPKSHAGRAEFFIATKTPRREEELTTDEHPIRVNNTLNNGAGPIRVNDTLDNGASRARGEREERRDKAD
jgi:hypothetical protein